MKVNNPIAFAKLGMSFSSIENDIIKISQQMEVEGSSLGRLTDLTLDKLRNAGERINSKIIDPCIKNQWNDSTPYKMGRGAVGLEQTTIGHLKDYLFNKYNILIQYAEEKGTDIESQGLHYIDNFYIQNRIELINSRQSSDGGACYIATQVYGSYEHPKVKILRVFRDEKLRKTWTGELLISMYYSISPVFVKYLAKYPGLQKFNRYLLELLIKELNNRRKNSR